MCSYIHGRRRIFCVNSVQYKSQAVEALNVVTRDIEVPNTLISENAGEHMGPQIELQ